tara:strand:+ start:1561 stop:1839 length:279 start_codon:yes stop_codon:yes gene_type:complete
MGMLSGSGRRGTKAVQTRKAKAAQAPKSAPKRRAAPLTRTAKAVARKPSSKPVRPVKKGKTYGATSVSGSSAKKPTSSKGKGLSSILTKKKR